MPVREKRNLSKRRRTRSRLASAVGILVALGALGVVVSLLSVAYLIRDLPSVEDIGSHQVAQSTKVYDRTGEVLLYEIYGEEKRTIIPFEEIPQHVKDATIAVEDDGFYQHPAFDWRATVRAIFTDIVYRKSIGGSTITQQLAKNLFFGPEKKISRKIREVIVAFRLEERYSKDEILGLYLNLIPYGGNAYGIEAASQLYFDKSARDLSLAEGATLAALPQAPSYFSPWGTHRAELFERRDFILGRMEGLGYIDTQQRTQAQAVTVEFAPQATTKIKAPHFVIGVQEYLVGKYGEDELRRSGLRVITTLDWEMQQAAEEAVAAGAQRNTELYQGHNAALVAQDARTGQVVALVGSKDYFGASEPETCISGSTCRFEGNFNVATQGLRQPGSAMKPFAYVTAFSRGYSPQTVVFDTQTEFAANNPACPLVVDLRNTHDECFHPENFDHIFRGPVQLRDALAQSINVPAVKALYLAGIDDTLATAHAVGISTLKERSRYGLSLVLGGGEVKLADLVGAYAAFAQRGVYRPQAHILEITDSAGNVLEAYRDRSAQAIDRQAADLLNNVLSDVDARRPLFANSVSLTTFPGREIALKTGTTNDYRDAWTIGYTPSLVAGVWAGNNNNAPMQQQGGSILAAVPIWHDFMSRVIDTQPIETFARPEPVVGNKPILNGDFAAGMQIHSILFYVDRRDPAGPIPVAPERDSQFHNWEEPVLAWARATIPNFDTQFNAPVDVRDLFDVDGVARPRISITSPGNGDFISAPIAVRAEIESPRDIIRLETRLNGEIVDHRSGNFGTRHSYSFVFTAPALQLQNSLTIRVWDSLNSESTETVILYQ